MVVLTERQRAFPGRVVFDHLAKTAGQAVNGWLRTTLGEGCVTPNLIGNHRELIQRYGGAHSVISAHVAFFGEGLDPRYDYVTCLREPVDRCLSWVFFAKENHQADELGPLWDLCEKFIASEGECSTDSLLKAYLQNYYVEHFAAIEGPPALSDAEKLEKALAAIECYDVWGFQEALPEFLNDLAALLDVAAPQQLERVNVTRVRPRTDRISATFRRRLEALNELDLEFYRILRERYHQSGRRPQKTVIRATRWTPYHGPADRNFESPDLALLSVTLDGTGTYLTGSPLVFRVAFSLAASVAELELGIHIFDRDRRWVFGTNTTLLQQPLRAPIAGTYQENWAVAADLPEGEYTAGFAFAERASGVQRGRELAWYDKLVGFRVKRREDARSVGYVSLPAAISWRYISARSVSSITDARGSLKSAAMLGDFVIGEEVTIPVVLANESSQYWGSVALHPIFLCCRWLDEAGNSIDGEEGERTHLLINGLSATESITLSLPIRAPGRPGHYRFQALPMQEGVGWFDQLGFVPLERTIRVSALDGARLWPAGDCRFVSGVGSLNSAGSWVSDGTEGYLLFGPYAELAAGTWSIHLDGAFDPLGRSIRVDVVTQRGSRCQAVLDLREVCTSVHLDFDLDDNVKDIEFRVWVDQGSAARVDGLVLEPSLIRSLQGPSSDPLAEGRQI